MLSRTTICALGLFWLATALLGCGRHEVVESAAEPDILEASERMSDAQPGKLAKGALQEGVPGQLVEQAEGLEHDLVALRWHLILQRLSKLNKEAREGHWGYDPPQRGTPQWERHLEWHYLRENLKVLRQLPQPEGCKKEVAPQILCQHSEPKPKPKPKPKPYAVGFEIQRMSKTTPEKESKVPRGWKPEWKL